MAEPQLRRWRWPALVLAAVALVLAAGVAVFWDDLQRNALDPKLPFQTYKPTRAPDYAQRKAWYLMPTDPSSVGAASPAADIFFLSPTTYDGGEQWNAPIDDRKGGKLFERAMAPNYAGPFVRVGRIFAPRYRQASLYTELTLREDAVAAREFAYGDVAQAFDFYLSHYNQGRPFILVGVEQGGTLGSRLLTDAVAANPAVQGRLVAAYLVETVVPADAAPIPPCVRKGQTGCLAAWVSAFAGELGRGQVLSERPLAWDAEGQLVTLNGRTPLCFNPILGVVTDAPAPARLNLGAANATRLEWDARPAFLARQVGAQCKAGVLEVSEPKSGVFKRTGSWADRRKVPPYNLFYGDLEADALARVAALTHR
ncbi:MAG: DUF3089 domain-containing protein [Phenylobacterium sp.]|nr:MAG: DUF3089 domain-containing protein [Phenylobacterium sp.]